MIRWTDDLDHLARPRRGKHVDLTVIGLERSGTAEPQVPQPTVTRRSTVLSTWRSEPQTSRAESSQEISS